MIFHINNATRINLDHVSGYQLQTANWGPHRGIYLAVSLMGAEYVPYVILDESHHYLDNDQRWEIWSDSFEYRVFGSMDTAYYFLLYFQDFALIDEISRLVKEIEKEREIEEARKGWKIWG